jgi:hypothetical protein
MIMHEALTCSLQVQSIEPARRRRRIRRYCCDSVTPKSRPAPSCLSLPKTCSQEVCAAGIPFQGLGGLNGTKETAINLVAALAEFVNSCM